MQWQFHYEGAPDGLSDALQKHLSEGQIPDEASDQFAGFSKMVLAEADTVELKGEHINVSAHASEGLEDQPVVHLSVDIKSFVPAAT